MLDNSRDGRFKFSIFVRIFWHVGSHSHDIILGLSHFIHCSKLNLFNLLSFWNNLKRKWKKFLGLTVNITSTHSNNTSVRRNIINTKEHIWFKIFTESNIFYLVLIDKKIV